MIGGDINVLGVMITEKNYRLENFYLVSFFMWSSNTEKYVVFFKER